MDRTRRGLIGAAAALPLLAFSRGIRAATGGVCALGWTSAQNLLAIGLVPRGMPERERYGRQVVEPAVPDAVLDIGARAEPNLELLDRLAPDRLVTDGSLTPVLARLTRIAPVTLFDSFDTGRSEGQLAYAADALRTLAATLGAEAAAARYLDEAERTLDAAAGRVRGLDRRPLYVVSVLDGRRALVYGRSSVFQDVLDRFGIENAWTGPVGPFGHATVTMDRLTERPDAGLVNVGNEGQRALDALAALPLFASLPFLRENRVTVLPAILFYGGVPSAVRFARLLSERLPGRG
jgi:ABC-type Fe3+-hydroxamate transport system substrate-binding protein